ncbi:MAG TPA: glycosyltransferase [Myxococcaceae bacterium]|jgi:sugar transferase (PEP-CTERM/EpsH1 system associated)
MKICFVTPRFPYPAIKGDTLRAFHQLQALSGRHQLTLVSLHDRPVPPEQMSPVDALCERVRVVVHPPWRAALQTGAGLFGRRPLQLAYYRSTRFRQVLDAVLGADRFDAVHVSLIRMAPYAWDLPAKLPVVVDLVDSISLNLLSRRDGRLGPARALYNLEYRRVRDYERAVAGHFKRLVISSPVDREVLGERVQVIPNGVDLDAFPFRGPEDRHRQTLIFTGNMAYPPNEEAARWFVRKVWPLLRSRWPCLRLEIAGASPGPRVRALEEQAGVSVLGRVPSMAEHLGCATVSVCPLQSGSGIQNKVLEAMAMGTPVVSTTVGNQGTQATPERDLLVADSPEAFASAVDRLLRDADLRARLATYGRAFVEERFQWRAHALALEALYAGESPPARARRVIPQGRLMTGRSAAAAIAEAKGQWPG